MINGRLIQLAQIISFWEPFVINNLPLIPDQFIQAMERTTLICPLTLQKMSHGWSVQRLELTALDIWSNHKIEILTYFEPFAFWTLTSDLLKN